jgi:sec-independent protein translocase protein TatC
MDAGVTGVADGRMSFFEHLAELRTRIIWSLVPTMIGVVAAFYFSDRIIRFVARPLTKTGSQLVFLSPTEAFWTSMKVSMVVAIFLAMPVILWQVWAFVSPGLHAHEKRFTGPFIIVGSLLFLAGGAFALLVVVPFAISFLVGFGHAQGIKDMISVSNHVDFVIKFTLAFALVFELPLALTLLARVGLVTPQFLSRNRKYAILVNFAIAAILTPTPDALNQAMMAGPLIILYEVGIVAARIFGRRAPRAAPGPAEADAAAPAGDAGRAS